MKYKIGDKVRIKSIDWYNENKDSNGNVVFSSKVFHISWCENVRTVFTKDMSKFCGKVVTIEIVWTANYSIVEGTHRDYFTDEMIEGLVEEVNTLKTQSNNMEAETHRGYCTTDVETTNESKKVAWFTFWDNDFADKVELDLSNRELIQEDGKWFVVKKKKSYPNTYEECYHITGLSKTSDIYSYKNGLLFNFQKLLIARDAYWKVAGDEMGLGKPWEPDWIDGEWKWCVCYSNNNIEFDSYKSIHHTFSFPTKEMRDAFYENFKELIEICKELL